MMNTRYRIQEPDVIHQMFDGEGVVVDLRNGSYYSLSEVGGVAWLAFNGAGSTLEQISRRIAKAYEASFDDVRADLEHFTQLLLDRDLILADNRPLASNATPDFEVMAATGARYLPPTLKLYNDLQDLLLLDPVHEVDAAMGWPKEAPESVNKAVGAVVRAKNGSDILVAAVPNGLVLVNRDLGRYCVGNAAAATLWERLSSGPVQMLDAETPLLAMLRDAGLVEASHDTEAPGLLDSAAVEFKLHCDLEAMMRPWIAGSLPARTLGSTQARQMVDRLDRCFEEAASRRGGSDCHAYAIGGYTLCLRTIPGEETRHLRSAISHLQIALPAAAHIDLTVSALSGQRNFGVPMLDDLLRRLRDNWEAVCGPRGEVLELHSEEVSAIYNAGPNVLVVISFERNCGWLLKLDDAPFPYWEIGSPFRFIWHEWFARKGLQYMHAAAVGHGAGGVLLVGQGGSGKSTTALLCAAAGMAYAGDDYCLVDPKNACANSLYNTGKLVGPEDYARLPELQGLSSNSDGFESGGEDKAVYFLSEIWPDRVVRQLALRAILIPQITGSVNTTIEPCEALDALAALLPSTVGQLPAAGRGDCERIAALVSQLPAYRLKLGTDRHQIPAAIQSLLES